MPLPLPRPRDYYTILHRCLGKSACKGAPFPLSLISMEAAQHAIEPQFLSQALSQGVKLRIGQMNKTELEGELREIGRYELNVDSGRGLITILKQDVSYLSAPGALVSPPSVSHEPAATDAVQVHAKPNIQQEFLDKAIREHHHLTIFLLTGQRVKATIEAYDNFTLLVREGDRQFLYYKHAITTINR
jgi:host factor-I protein